MEKLAYTLTPEDIDPWMFAVNLVLASLVARNLWKAGSYVINRFNTLTRD